ncbi:MAG: hypothetical protein JNL18_02800 [Planctomycetaceae bacterium]|nr:hypothetical protein [Planctomycetaceae bacterium]
MATVEELAVRIRGKLAEGEQQIKQFQSQKVEEHHARREREQQLEQWLDSLREVWRPRLEALSREFGDRLKVTPNVTPGRREALFEATSPLASIKLKFTASANADVTELVLTYDLDILPILMKFERHAEIAFPLDKVNESQLTEWIDDRIITFVQTYLEMHSNQYYLQDHMVEDPIAHVRFPKFAAGATRQRGKETLYFISESTAAEFK